MPPAVSHASLQAARALQHHRDNTMSEVALAVEQLRSLHLPPDTEHLSDLLLVSALHCMARIGV